MIEWNSDYLVGVDEIDLQHQYFAKLINRIEAKIPSIAHTDVHSPLLTELIYYARFHFLSEENIMAEARSIAALREKHRVVSRIEYEPARLEEG